MRSSLFWPVVVAVVQLMLSTRASAADENKVIGIWRPEPEILAKIEKRFPNRAVPELELRAGGRFEFINIPASWSDVFGQPAGGIGGAAGTWRLIEGASNQIQLQALGVSMVVTTARRRGSDIIIVHVRDGENPAPMAFVRSPRKPSQP